VERLATSPTVYHIPFWEERVGQHAALEDSHLRVLERPHVRGGVQPGHMRGWSTVQSVWVPGRSVRSSFVDDTRIVRPRRDRRDDALGEFGPLPVPWARLPRTHSGELPCLPRSVGVLDRHTDRRFSAGLRSVHSTLPAQAARTCLSPVGLSAFYPGAGWPSALYVSGPNDPINHSNFATVPNALSPVVCGPYTPLLRLPISRTDETTLVKVRLAAGALFAPRRSKKLGAASSKVY